MHNHRVGNLDERMDTEPLDTPPVPEPAGAAELDDPEGLGIAALAGLDGEATGAAPVLPPVVAVVVTEGGPGLEATLASPADQEYPSLSTLVIDRGSADELTARVAEVYPHAYVRRLPGHRSFTEAANVAFG